MSDFRVADTAAQTRLLDEFRHLDQSERAQAQRVAASVTSHDIEKQHKDVEESHRAVEQQPEQERHPGERREAAHHEPQEEKKEREEPRTPLECPEGHLLDLKA